MKIRQLQSSDIKQVIDLWTSSFSRTFDNPVNNNYLNDPNSITFVMSDNKAILGVASLHIIEKLTRKLGLIEDVAVSKNNRGLGIGKKLSSFHGPLDESGLRYCVALIVTDCDDSSLLMIRPWTVVPQMNPIEISRTRLSGQLMSCVRLISDSSASDSPPVVIGKTVT